MIDIERLIKLIGMTGSSHDGECLAAIRKANALLVAADMSWEDIIRGRWRSAAPPPREAATPPPPRETSARPDGRYSGENVVHMIDMLLKTVPPNSSFRMFILSIQAFYLSRGYVTSKQYAALQRATSGFQFQRG